MAWLLWIISSRPQGVPITVQCHAVFPSADCMRSKRATAARTPAVNLAEGLRALLCWFILCKAAALSRRRLPNDDHIVHSLLRGHALSQGGDQHGPNFG